MTDGATATKRGVLGRAGGRVARTRVRGVRVDVTAVVVVVVVVTACSVSRIGRSSNLDVTRQCIASTTSAVVMGVLVVGDQLADCLRGLKVLLVRVGG